METERIKGKDRKRERESERIRTNIDFSRSIFTALSNSSCIVVILSESERIRKVLD